MWKPRLPAGPGGDGGTERASPTVERKIPLSATKPAGVQGRNRGPDAWNGRVPEDGRRPLSERTGTDRTGAGRSQHVRAAGTGVTATAVRERRGRQRSLEQRAGPDPAVPDTDPTAPLTAGCGATATAPAAPALQLDPSGIRVRTATVTGPPQPQGTGTGQQTASPTTRQQPGPASQQAAGGGSAIDGESTTQGAESPMVFHRADPLSRRYHDPVSGVRSDRLGRPVLSGDAGSGGRRGRESGRSGERVRPDHRTAVRPPGRDDPARGPQRAGAPEGRPAPTPHQDGGMQQQQMQGFPGSSAPSQPPQPGPGPGRR